PRRTGRPSRVRLIGARPGDPSAGGSVIRVHPTSARLPLALAIPLALLCGVGVSVQSRINGELAQQLGSGATAALFSFGSGLIVLIVAAAVSPTARRGTRRLYEGARRRTFPAYLLFGGCVGAFFV